jgi:Pectate lyase superfamily protein
MPKSIPTSGTLNWSIPLNDHISQLQDPTNGAINSFSQFSGRPTNLTANDIGKTYLYTQTGNIHQWTGTTWKVLNESVVNVKDYGAVGDGVTNDSVAVQGLLDDTAIDKNKSLYFPQGKYLLNISMRYYAPNIIGQGNHSTILSSFASTGFVFTINRNDTWLPFEIKDLAIVGDVNNRLNSSIVTPSSKNGIQFGNPTNIDTDQYAGGLRLINVEMSNLNVAILKRYGNIGNYFESCSFVKSNYHYKVYSVLPSSVPNNLRQHAGCDSFYKCEFDSATKAAVYINGNNEGINGQNIFRDCVFQYNSGFAFCIIDYVGITRPNIVIESTWIEDNAKTVELGGGNAPAIDIDGVLRIPRTFLFINSTATIEKTMITDIELVRSQVRAIGAGLGQVTPLNVIKDNASFLYFDESSANGDANIFTKNHAFLLRGSVSNYHISQPRAIVSNSDENLIYSNSFSNVDSLQFTNIAGTALTTFGQSFRDGTLYSRCVELDFNVSNNSFSELFFGVNDNILLPANKYIFWSIDVKKISGGTLPFVLNAGSVFSNQIKISKPNWTTYIGLGDTTALTTATKIALDIYSNGIVAKVRIANFQVLAFDTLQELMEYSESLQFRNSSESSISHRLSVPTTGTYNKGDIVYNTNPASAGYVGWVCTVGGTPGTW